MIKNLNILGQPSKDKLSLFVSVGIALFVLGIIDVILTSFFEINITSFLPRWLIFLRLFYLVLVDFIILELNFQETKH